MANIKGLIRRGRVYYSRISVPRDVAHTFGRKQIWKSLHTERRDEAEPLHFQHVAKWTAAFAEAKRTAAHANAIPSPLDDEQAARLARQFFDRAKRKIDFDHSHSSLEPAERDAAIENVQFETALLSSWDHPDAHLIVDAAMRSAAPGQTDAAAQNELLADLLRRALVQLGALELARLNGDYNDRINDAFFKNPPMMPSGNAQAAPTISIGEAITRFETEALAFKSVSAKTRMKHRALLRQIRAHFGDDAALADVTRADCNAFRDILAKLPPNFSKLQGHRTLASMATGNASGPRLAWDTQSSYLKMLSNLFEWARRERLVRDNVAEAITPLAKRQPAESQRLPFERGELEKMFAAPLYVGCQNDNRGFAKRGPNVIRKSRFWLPLLGLYTGLRMNELLQLTPDHVRRSPKDNAYFAITRDMQLKTDNAEREVPIHPQLEAIGFLDWVEVQRTEDAKLLFADVPQSKHGYMSDVFTKRFATFLRSIDLNDARRSKLCFHSFRHSFKDALNATGAPEEVKEEICGWARSKRTGRRYGTGLRADQLKCFIDRVDYELDLTHLATQVSR